MKITIKIGGSILFKNNNYDAQLIKNYSKTIRKLFSEKYDISKVVIVTGGGRLSRELVSVAKSLSPTMSNAHLDLLGIYASRLNSMLFIAALKDLAYPFPPESFEEALRLMSGYNKLIISGGLQPGQSTNAVAAILAEASSSDLLVNFSNITKVYDKDPKLYSEAKPFDVLNYEHFISIVQENQQKPGNYELFDLVGAEIVKRSNIPLYFVNGYEPDLLFEILDGKNPGTLVTSSE